MQTAYLCSFRPPKCKYASGYAQNYARLCSFQTPPFKSSDFCFAAFGLKGVGMDIVTFDFVTLSTFHIIQGKRPIVPLSHRPIKHSRISSAAIPKYNIYYIIL